MGAVAARNDSWCVRKGIRPFYPLCLNPSYVHLGGMEWLIISLDTK